MRQGSADRGRRNDLAGRAAEAAVERHYERNGRTVCARRWRGPGGEIDLIARDGAEVIFIEVKQSRSIDAAAWHVSSRQMARIHASAEDFIGREPRGLLTPCRFDVALVDGQGRIEVIENVMAA